MKRLLGRLGAIVAVSVCAAMVSQSSAYGATASALAVVGGGTISPGLTATPNFQGGTFSGTVAGAVIATPGAATGLGSCNFTFSSTIAETSAQGQGVASGTCSGGTIGTASVSCSLTYSRAGALVVIQASCNVSASGPTGSGTGAAAAVGVFVFVPTSGNGVTAPITGYSLVGVAAGAGA